MEGLNSQEYRDNLAKDLKEKRAKGNKTEGEDLLNEEKGKLEYEIANLANIFHRDNKRFNGKEYKEELKIEEILNKASDTEWEHHGMYNAMKEIIEKTKNIDERINAMRATLGLNSNYYTRTEGDKGYSTLVPNDVVRTFHEHLDAGNYGYGETCFWYPGMEPSNKRTEEEIDEDIKNGSGPYDAPDGFHWGPDYLQGQYYALYADNISKEQDELNKSIMKNLDPERKDAESKNVRPLTW